MNKQPLQATTYKNIFIYLLTTFVKSYLAYQECQQQFSMSSLELQSEKNEARNEDFLVNNQDVIQRVNNSHS